MSKIFVIEDELAINKMICLNLSVSGYETRSAYDGREALDAIRSGEQFDLALVDVMLPEINGFELLEHLKGRDIPVIFLTAKGDLESKLQGLTGGAEDYIVKPFEMLELIARMENVLKRHGSQQTLFKFGDTIIDTKERSVKRAGEPVSLTPIEFDLLLLLVRNKNVALTRRQMLADVWGILYEGGTRTVDVHIAQLRKKTELNIVSVPKIGYRLEE